MKIFIEKKYREKYFNLVNKVFDSNFWSEGEMGETFERNFSKFINLESLAVTSGGAAILSILEYVDVKGWDVILPANTFWATAIAVKKAGGNPVYADCSKEDLCITLKEIKKNITRKTKAVIVVHIGGHIAFDIENIAKYCNKKGIFLIEDCAHAHGAEYKGVTAGAWGIAGAYSFYSTKTMPLGEGGMVVSKNKEFIDWLRSYRNYGKKKEKSGYSYLIKNGFNFRMNEVTAALGIIQLQRLPMILRWKRNLAKKYDKIFERRINFPEGMKSGYYKYIVFDYNLKETSGKVYAKSDLSNLIDMNFNNEISDTEEIEECMQQSRLPSAVPNLIDNKSNLKLPNTYWIAEHHQCVPIYYGLEYSAYDIKKIKSKLFNNQ